MNHLKKSSIAAMAAIFTIMPFAIDTYIPAIPQIATDLSTNVEYVAMTISLYIFVVAIGQLLGGYLSDKFGRITVIASGLFLFALSGFYLITIDSIIGLWIGRICQALGAGVAIVGVPAIIRDNAEGKEAGQLFTLIGFIGILGPAIAPIAGAIILLNFNWHAIFVFLGIYGLLMTLISKTFLPKARKKQNTDIEKPSLVQSYISIFKEKRAIGFLIANALFFSSFFTFLANASVAYMDYFGVSETLFTALFTTNIIFVIIVNRTNAYLLNRKEPHEIVQVFQRIQLAGTIFLLCTTLFAPHVLWLAVVGFIASSCFNSGIGPNLNALFMSHFPHNAGTASGVYGAFQAIVSAIISAIATFLYNGTLVPVAAVIFTCAISAFFIVRWQLNYNQRLDAMSVSS